VAAVDPRWERRFRAASAVLSAGVVAIGLVVLVGWLLDIALFRSVFPEFATMKSNTAVLFILLAIGLWLARSRAPRAIRAKHALGLIVALGAVVTLAEYVVDLDLGIDELLFRDTRSVAYPGRMAPATALSFLLLGLALFLQDRPLPPIMNRATGLLAGVSALIPFLGYLYGAPSLYAIGIYASLALPTAVAFLLAASAFLLARPTEAITHLLASDSAAGRLLRRLLPAILLVPVIFGWVQLRGQAAGYYDARFGVALMTLSTVIALTCFSSVIATSLARSDQRLRDGEQRFRALVDASAQIVWSTDATGTVMDDSPSWRAFTGQTDAQLRGVGWLDALHPEDRDRVTRAWRDAVRAKASVADEFRVHHCSGQWRWMWSRTVPLRDPEGNVWGWIGMDTDITPQKIAEAGRERQLREMVENAPHAVALLDRNLRCAEVSPRWLREYGLGSDVIGESHYEIFPEIPEHWKAVHRRCLAGATEQNDGEPFLRHDGSVQWIRWKVCPWRDLEGTIAGILIYSEDITAQREAEAAAHATQEQLRLAQRVARIGTFDWNIQTGVNTWTPELERMYGLPVGGFPRTQAAWEDLVHPDDRADAVQRVEEAFTTGAPTEGEWRVCWPDGSTHWLSGRFQVFEDDAGRPLRMIGINIEITERKRAEEQRERLLAEIRDLTRNLEVRVEERTKEVAVARDRLDGIISMAADAIIAIDDDQRITIFNRGAEEIFGWTREEVLGKPLDLLLPEHLRGLHRDRVASFASEPTKARPMAERRAVRGRRKNGDEFPAETAISGQQTDGGPQLTVILRDITARRCLEDEQARIHAERAVLLKEIHHRVKNNLQVISSLFYLQAQRTEQDNVRRLLDESRGRLQSIALIHEKLYRSEQLASIDFGDYLRDLTASLTSAVGVQVPYVKVRVEAEEIFLDIDRAIPCALIVNELVSNSMKHAFPGGRHGEIRIAVTRADSELEVEVNDTGIGFPADLDLQNVTTLGLQLVASLTKQLRGTVELVRGEGTTFRIHVPVHAPTYHRTGATAHAR